MISALVESELVVADLTGHNPNVFYELAIRHAVAKPYVQMIDSEQTLPFDISTLRTIHFDYRDLDSAHKARESLRRCILDYEQGAEVDSPGNGRSRVAMRSYCSGSAVGMNRWARRPAARRSS